MAIHYYVWNYGRAGFTGAANRKRFNDLASAWGNAARQSRKALARCGVTGARLAPHAWGFSIVDASGAYIGAGAGIRCHR